MGDYKKLLKLAKKEAIDKESKRLSKLFDVKVTIKIYSDEYCRLIFKKHGLRFEGFGTISSISILGGYNVSFGTYIIVLDDYSYKNIVESRFSETELKKLLKNKDAIVLLKELKVTLTSLNDILGL